MIKCALHLLIFATCIVGIFADEFCEKQRKLDSECAKYCYQVAKPLLHMAPICHNKDAEIKELNAKIANLQNELVVYKQQEKKSLEEVKLNEDFNAKLDDMQNKLFYEERERKSKEEENKYNKLNDKFIELNKNLAIYEYRERKSLEEGTICNELTTKLTDLQNKLIVNEEREKKSLDKEKQYNELNGKFNELNKKLGVYEERERKSLEEVNKYNELNEKLDKQLRLLLNSEEREKKDIAEINLNKQLNVQLGEVQEKLANCEERENKSKEIYSKAESRLQASLEEYRKKLSNLESSNLALNISNQEVKEDLKHCNIYTRGYKNTCLKQWPGEDTTGTVKIEGMEAFDVSCVNDLSSGPGWMLIQKRIDKRKANYFYHNWPVSRNGFSYDDSFFIGLEKLYRLTNAVPHELYIDMEDWDGNKKFARYDNFRVGNESEQYPLKDLGNYTPDSNAGDALRNNNNMKFSTKDRDNDNSPNVDCARKYLSSWWHNNCTKANLNGYQYAQDMHVEAGIWWDSRVPLKRVRMLIRPKLWHLVAFTRS